VTLLAGSEEHRRRWSTVAGEAEEAVAGDELAPGPEVLGVSSSRVLRVEGRWGSGSPVRTTVGREGWRWRARATAKEQRRAEWKRKGTQPRRGSYVGDKGMTRMRRW
jgi:hypothetical protein